MKNSQDLKIKSAAERIVLKDYLRLPYRLYMSSPDTPYWVPPLMAEKLLDTARRWALSMGILEEHRSKGIGLILYQHIFDNAKRHHFRSAELSWILENNRMMNRVLEHIDAKKNKTYGIFEKLI